MIDPHSALINLHIFCLVCSFSLYFFFLGGGGREGLTLVQFLSNKFLN